MYFVGVLDLELCIDQSLSKGGFRKRNEQSPNASLVLRINQNCVGGGGGELYDSAMVKG